MKQRNGARWSSLRISRWSDGAPHLTTDTRITKRPCHVAYGVRNGHERGWQEESVIGNETVGSLCRQSGGYVPLAKSFATSRAQSMKSCATGLTVRFFNRIVATGQGRCGSLIDMTFSNVRLSSSCRMEVGNMVTKRPVASRLL